MEKVQTGRLPKGPWRRSLERFRQHKLAMVGLVVLTTLCLLAVFAPLVSSYSPNTIDLRSRNSPPSSSHWLGTDGVGRDEWARLVYGGRISLTVAFTAVAISSLIAIVVGAISGYFGGWVELVVMRVTDVAMSLPPLVLAMTLLTVLNPGLLSVIIAIGLLSWPGTTRLVRSQVLAVREQDFVLAARALGLSPVRIIFRQILPHVLSPVIVAATLQMASAIILEASLSFLGLGIPLPTATWGNMLQDARTLTILESAPWLWIPPGVAIIVCVLSVNSVGDGLRDALDPRLIR